ncbi:asparagine synthase (glutamine-hydrolyzing) [Streptomyces longwoodensis]|uniref:asparagine synthase (glutamine-hydrolyzing) n=1 Tax=Streptomyces longwoodensis TaxID=68231 RepID=UPI002254FFD8|nr:asparagine synthase (glutamine-hydrolyzing) [Streptomyces longwoodensis]MCX4997479.1 asparagine synthase (glutamine-hydrolyzing) [Streptomyces longwoodensis]WRY92100.1 asparagine synthase (glutamine-hydrolyzing) [Streptomyces longwoodensis]WUC56380.1 asparagine synthase (glutamine-hydrolyzing) [Streptomyces longwoodensis]WUC69915.1 asparagine synthase (glutamine-hydrolyzing) [Streptomyces longwoodensis]
MCRIYGSFGGATISPQVWDDVAGTMREGGPDEMGRRCGDGWTLGNNRLAIQGVPDGHQPFERPGLSCVFNGEIYNHRALRAELTTRGYSFTGDCDGDVLLPLYEVYGDAFVGRLEGMFAVAVVDRREEPCLKLFTDHAGMKSLYYYLSGSGSRLCFASELRALSRLPDFPDTIDPLAVDRYLGGRAIWGPGTVHTRVRTLKPGSVLRFADGRLTVGQTPLAEDPVGRPDGEPTVAAAAARLDEILRDEMSRMLDADVPVCVITSGGLDSSYTTALAADLVPDLASFNIAYRGEWPSDERHFAEEVARHCGTRHHQVLLDPATFPALVERYVRHLDQPNNAPHSLSTFALFEAVHQAGFKVALTGDGADELFAGYARFGKAAQDGSLTWHRAYQDAMAAVHRTALERLYTPEYLRLVQEAGGFFGDGIGDDLDERVRSGQHGKLETLLRYDQFERFPYYILRRVDHLGMAHSVEARIPFLQPSVVRLAHSLPAHVKVADGVVKAPVAEAARRWVPRSVVERPKQPFTLPITAMIKPGEALYGMIGDLLLAPGARCHDYVRTRAVRDLFRTQTETPTADAAETLWSLLVLETWLSARVS